MLAESDPELVLTLPSEREIAFTRICAAAPARVFAAWTTPDDLREWWGCAGSRLTVCEVDLRPGGGWRFVMRMPDGSDHPFKGVYRGIVLARRLVYTECYDVPSIGSP